MGSSGSEESASTPPRELAALLSARDATAQESAWSAFVRNYSRLILHVARTLGGDHDAVMDRYAYVLEQLRKDDCRRLRGYHADGRGKFTTWLTVVLRRMALDQRRERYGRKRTPEPSNPGDADETRRRLADLVGVQLDLERLADPSHDSPERNVRRAELAEKLSASVRELGPDDRLLLTLRFYDGLAAREIAGIMGFPTPFHVYRRVNAVLATLRQMLERQGVRDPNP